MLDGSICPSCNAANPRINRFCNQCGHSLVGNPASPQVPSSQSPSPPSGCERPANSFNAALSPGRSVSLPSLRPLVEPALRRFNLATAIVGLAMAKWALPLMGAGGAATVLAQIGLLFSIELNEKAPIGYLLLLGLGVALFAVGSAGLWVRRSRDFPVTINSPSSASLQPSSFGTFGGTIALLSGAIALGVLIALLAAGSTWGWTLVPWVLALGAFSAPFLRPLRLAEFPLVAWIRHRYLDLILVLALMAGFIGLNLVDLQDWYYSAIGDEFLFFEHAKHIAESGVERPFSQEGVYNKHPVMNSVFQAAVMRVFGVDYFGWTFSEVLNGAIAIPGIYLLGHMLGGRKAAVISAALFASSHFIFAFSHVGYNNLSPIPVAVWSLALFILGWRNGNPLLLYAAGAIAGFGFYTHYSGRAILPVMLLFALTAASPRRVLDLWPLVLGFALTVAPTFVVEQEQVFTRMFDQVVGGYSEVVAGSTGNRILNNIEINLPAFNYNSTVHSYVYGPLMDPVSAVLAVLGIGFALGSCPTALYAPSADLVRYRRVHDRYFVPIPSRRHH